MKIFNEPVLLNECLYTKFKCVNNTRTYWVTSNGSVFPLLYFKSYYSVLLYFIFPSAGNSHKNVLALGAPTSIKNQKMSVRFVGPRRRPQILYTPCTLGNWYYLCISPVIAHEFDVVHRIRPVLVT